MRSFYILTGCDLEKEPIKRGCIMRKIKQAFIFLILPAFLFSCTTMKDVKRPPKLGFDDPVLSKGIDYRGTEGIPKDPATSFTIQDREVVASIKLTDLTGKHSLRWEWYRPDGKRYFSSKNLSIKASRDKYLREATAWHKLSIRGENAANYTKGYWKVKIYLDKRLIASKPFEILEKTREVADNVPPAIMLSSPVNNFETTAPNIILKGKIVENVNFSRLQIKLGDKVLYNLKDLNVSQEEEVGSVSVIEKAITLNAGPNDIIVEAVDIAGNKARRTLTVIYKFTPPTRKREGEHYAVIIGIGKYQDKKIPPLKYATADAQAIYDILTNPNYGTVPRDHVKLLLDEKATERKIESAIGKWLKRKSSKKDTVTIFFAGHGAPEDKETYWVTHDAEIDDLYSTALNNNRIVEMLDRVRAKKMVVFLDSCYSAATVNRTDKTRALSRVKIPYDKFKGEGRAIITSSTGEEQSLELDKFGHGVFSYYLVKALKGEADKNKDGYIELDEVWTYVRERVTNTASGYGLDQTPVMKADYSGKILLSQDPERLRQISLGGRIATMRGHWEKDEISSKMYKKAVGILKSGEKNKALDAFLTGEIDLDTFKESFN